MGDLGQQLAVSIASTVLVWRFSNWRPSQGSPGKACGLRRLQRERAWDEHLSQLRATTDRALIGRFLGASALGVYGLAYNVILVPFNRIGIPIAQVLFPALSRIQEEPERVADYWRRSVQMLAALAIPRWWV